MESLFGILLACAMGALIASISYKNYQPKFRRLSLRKPKKKVRGPSESQKHRIIMELLGSIDALSKDQLTPEARYTLKKARKHDLSDLYRKTEDVYNDLARRASRNQGAVSNLNSIGLYRTAIRIALLEIANKRISDLKEEVVSWGFDEVAPMAGAGLDTEDEPEERASRIALPI